nr:hypothetical protein [Mycolicibacterium bacteremicum]
MVHPSEPGRLPAAALVQILQIRLYGQRSPLPVRRQQALTYQSITGQITLGGAPQHFAIHQIIGDPPYCLLRYFGPSGQNGKRQRAGRIDNTIQDGNGSPDDGVVIGHVGRPARCDR